MIVCGILHRIVFFFFGIVVLNVVSSISIQILGLEV